MKLKRVGFFKELRHGDPFGMSIKESIRSNSIENEDKIIAYLDRGITFCVTPGLVSDVLDETRGIIRNLEILTDGIWVWPSDLSYYVKFYHVILDVEFIDHMKNNMWVMPTKEEVDLLKLEF